MEHFAMEVSASGGEAQPLVAVEPDPSADGLEVPAEELNDVLTAARKFIFLDPSRASRLIIHAIQLINGTRQPNSRRTENVRGGLASHQVNRVLAHIEQRFAEQITLHRLAELSGLSDSHFSRAFKQTFSTSPHAYILKTRLEQAKIMMLADRRHLSEIAAGCGFSDQAHFSRHFHRAFGMTPSQWRRRFALQSTEGGILNDTADV